MAARAKKSNALSCSRRITQIRVDAIRVFVNLTAFKISGVRMKIDWMFSLAASLGLAASVFADPPVAQDDLVAVNQGVFETFSVLEDNGNGADFDPDGDPFRLIYLINTYNGDGRETINLGTSTRLNGVQSQAEDFDSGPARFQIRGRFDGTIDTADADYVWPTSLGAGRRARTSFDYALSPTRGLGLIGGESGQIFQASFDGSEATYFVQIEPVGDFNGDGFDDWAVIPRPVDASNVQPHARVVFGGENIEFDAIFNLSDSDTDQSRRLTPDGLGFSVITPIGDIDGDGKAELAIGNTLYYGAAHTDPVDTLEIVQGVVDRDTTFLRGSSDFDGDGVNDLAVQFRDRAGNVSADHFTVVYGTPTRRTGTVNLSDLDDQDFFQIIFTSASLDIPFDHYWIGDVTGDDLGDIPIRQATGENFYILPGLSPRRTGSIDSSDAFAQGGIRLERQADSGELVLGDPIGDINGDGITDLALRLENWGNNPDREFFVFGSAALPSTISVDQQSLPTAVFGEQTGDVTLLSRQATIAGDLNGDGIDDLLYNFSGPLGEMEDQEGIAVFYGRANWPGELIVSDLDGSSGIVTYFSSYGRSYESSPDPNCEGVAQFFGDIDNDGDADAFIFDPVITSSEPQNAYCHLAGSSSPFGTGYDPQVSTGTVTVDLVGTNDLPVIRNQRFEILEHDYVYEAVIGHNAGQSYDTESYEADSSDRLFVSAVEGNAAHVGRWRPGPLGGRFRIESEGVFEFDPQGADFVGFGETVEFSLDVTYSSTDQTSHIGQIVVEIGGSSDLQARNDYFAIQAGQEFSGNILADNGQGADVFDSGQDRLLQSISPGLTNFPMTRTLENGSQITLQQNGDFVFTPSDDAAMAGAVPETVYYRISGTGDPRFSHAIAVFSIIGVNDEMRTLTVEVSGNPGTSISVIPPYETCSGVCEYQIPVGLAVGLSSRVQRLPDGSSQGDPAWGGACSAVTGSYCSIDMSEDRVVTAEFTPANRPTVIYASTLPAARSSVLGGDPATIFATVANANRFEATNCVVSPQPGDPFNVTYQRTDATNTAIGNINEPFSVPAGGFQTLVLGFTPFEAFAGQDFFPLFACQNGTVTPVRGLNSVFLSASETPVPDILSIGATPSGDGVIRIPSVGGISFLSAAAINIGAGDAAPDGLDAPQANEATITVTADTGLADLPLDITLCETGPDARCLAPRAASVESQIGDAAKTFAVFVRASADAGVAFDPANARVYLRFTDSGGVVRSVTSAAVTAPAPDAAGDLAGVWALSAATGREHVEYQLVITADGSAMLIGEGAVRYNVRTGQTDTGLLSLSLTDNAGNGIYSGVLRPGLSLTLQEQATGRILRGVAGDASELELSAGHYQLIDARGDHAGDLSIMADGQMTGEAGGCAFAARMRSVDVAETGFAGCAASTGWLSLVRRFDFETQRYRPALSLTGLAETVFWIEPALPQ